MRKRFSPVFQAKHITPRYRLAIGLTAETLAALLLLGSFAVVVALVGAAVELCR